MKKSLLKAAALFTALVFTAALFSGCAPQKSDPSLKGKSISVVTTYGPNDGGYLVFKELCNEFSSTTGAEISDNSADSTEEWKQSVLDSFKTGTEPDVLFFFTGRDVEPLITENSFVSLEEIQLAYPDYAFNINLAVLEGLKASNGKSYAVPVKGYWERLFVNADIFSELGLSFPEKYEDLYEIAPVLLEAGYIPIAASLSEVPHYLFEAFLFNETGPSKHLEIPKDPNNPPQSWISAFTQLKRAYDANMFPENTETISHAEAFELFQSKKAAMIIDGDWSVPYVRDTENSRIINFPAKDGGARNNTDLISGFSMGYYISEKAWNNPDKRDAAVAFVQFITSNASILRLNVSGAAMPISISPSDRNSQQGNNITTEKTPLRLSIDGLNEHTTAFVGAAADNFSIEARSWLFSHIMPFMRGEIDVNTLLSEFIKINNES